MFYIKVKGYFSSAHNLRNYHGSCENLHGHNWVVEAVFKGKHLGQGGMLIDFREARGWLTEILDYLDHRYLNDLPPFKEINPTSENIACYIFKELDRRLKEKRVISVSVHLISVWENERSCAMYGEDEEE